MTELLAILVLFLMVFGVMVAWGIVMTIVYEAVLFVIKLVKAVI
jgi:hypothetical protein